MNKQELSALKKAIERSLELLGEQPADPSPERNIYDQLVQLRETLHQLHPELLEDE